MRQRCVLLFLSALTIAVTVYGSDQRLVSGISFTDTVTCHDTALGDVALLRVAHGSEDCTLYELDQGYPVVYAVAEETIFFAAYGSRSGDWGALVSSGLPLYDGIPPEGIWPGATITGAYREYLQSRQLDTRDWNYDVQGEYRIAIVPIAPSDAPGWYDFPVEDVVPILDQYIFEQTIPQTPLYVEGETNQLSVRDHFLWAAQHGNGGINLRRDELRGDYHPDHPGWIAEGWNGNVPQPVVVPVTLDSLIYYPTEMIMSMVAARLTELGFSTETDPYNVFLLLWGVPPDDAGGWALPLAVTESHMSASIWTDHQLLSSGEICRMIFGTLGYGELDPAENDIGRAHLLCEGWQGPPRISGEKTYWKPAWVDPFIEECLGWWNPIHLDPEEDYSISFFTEDRRIFVNPQDSSHRRTLTLFTQANNFYAGHRYGAGLYLCETALISWNNQYRVNSIPAVCPGYGHDYAFPYLGVDSLLFEEWQVNHPHFQRLSDITAGAIGGSLEIEWLQPPPVALVLEECTIDLEGNGLVALRNQGMQAGLVTVTLSGDGWTGYSVPMVSGLSVTGVEIQNLPSAPASELGESIPCHLLVVSTGGDTLMDESITAGRTLAPTHHTPLMISPAGLYCRGDTTVAWKRYEIYVVVDDEVIHYEWVPDSPVLNAWLSESGTKLIVKQGGEWHQQYWYIRDLSTGGYQTISFNGLLEPGLEIADELHFFTEAVGDPETSWLWRYDLTTDDMFTVGGILPIAPDRVCALQNHNLHLLALVESDHLVICDRNSTVLHDWTDPGAGFGQPHAADLNWNGWLDLLLPCADGWHIFYWDAEQMSFNHYFHWEEGVYPTSIMPVFNGERVGVGCAGEDFMLVGSQSLNVSDPLFTAIQGADLDEDGIYEYFATSQEQGTALITATGDPFYGDYEPWLLHNLFSPTRACFTHTQDGVRLVTAGQGELLQYALGCDFPIWWNGEGNICNRYAHPVTAELVLPPPQLDITVTPLQAGTVVLTLNPLPGGHILNGFYVYRSDDPYQFPSEPVEFLDPCTENWIDTNPLPGACYYRVTMMLDDPEGLICPESN